MLNANAQAEKKYVLVMNQTCRLCMATGKENAQTLVMVTLQNVRFLKTTFEHLSRR